MVSRKFIVFQRHQVPLGTWSSTLACSAVHIGYMDQGHNTAPVAPDGSHEARHTGPLAVLPLWERVVAIPCKRRLAIDPV
ncbi:hypothetical protein [Halomonas cupida]|uniref:Uncharacterized protein n=1 Tax=Halomonas cupida TaxID=44933 RepID=A0A1M7G0C9_9GAMM|nr:hypothetical protein [Halomonas cupida]GEN23603.1 hypothetical protein HCU01_15520 [Halomonas cupida]SHM09814.1 hypothetical protein SAMN05660971_02142 [Halomonas cupida]